jgi:NADPH-dependent 2,4-dienoyl-CoA reductase/sulfur reductase-like enzyme
MEVDMVTNFDYLIVGGGMTAAAAAQGIREIDSTGSIGLISLEDQPPYNRPPLTKKLWQGKPESMIWSDLPKEHLELILGSRVSRLEPRMKQLQDGTGRTYGYKKLLLATGGSPRQLPFAPEETVYYRSVKDYHTVREWTGENSCIGIIGGGFIGSEIAAALASNGEHVLMIFPENGIGARIYPGDLAQFVTQYYQQKGVEVHAGMEVQGIEKQENGFVLRAQAGQTVEVNHIIAGIGIIPNVELAQSAEIAIGDPSQGGGILVDKYLATNLPEIYAAGDVASFYNPFLKQWMRVEHEDNANSMGQIAGINMAGQATPYYHQPFFYSDFFDLGFEAVGELNSRLEIYADWKELFKEGVIYYLSDGRVKGVLLWNVWNTIDAARALIDEPGPFKASDLKNRLP